MKKTLFALSLVVVAVVFGASAQHQNQQQHRQHQSPAPGQATRKPKTLSDAELENYTNGRGMGLAKPAELNSYPGPMHVLQLSESLALTANQKSRTQQLFERMKVEAVRLGHAIIAKESELDKLFSSGAAEQTAVRKLTADIAALQGELRLTHLRAHLDMKQILTSKQINLYDELRGYKSAE